MAVEPQLNEPLYNEVLGITSSSKHGQNIYSKMYGTKPVFNEPRFNEILLIINTIHKGKGKIYLDIMNKIRNVCMW